ncbi:MAG: GNAT family N-acetyltransferase [Angustibacter sp.]
MEISEAGSADLDDLARLLWSHASPQERAAQPLASFTHDLARWWDEHRSTHVAFVARLRPDVEGHQVVGMAWLAFLTRPPRPGTTDRRSADIQSVYVEPDARGRGIGVALVNAATAHAWRRGAERVTVHSSSRAVALYERLGFQSSVQLLQVDRPR